MPVDSDDDFDRHAKVDVTAIDMNIKTTKMYDVFIMSLTPFQPNNFRRF